MTERKGRGRGEAGGETT